MQTRTQQCTCSFWNGSKECTATMTLRICNENNINHNSQNKRNDKRAYGMSVCPERWGEMALRFCFHFHFSTTNSLYTIYDIYWNDFMRLFTHGVALTYICTVGGRNHYGRLLLFV